MFLSLGSGLSVTYASDNLLTKIEACIHHLDPYLSSQSVEIDDFKTDHLVTSPVAINDQKKETLA